MKAQSVTNHRFWELDFMRGVAVVLMVGYHFCFSQAWFMGVPFDFTSWYWVLLARLIQLIFITLVGMSMSISYAHLQSKNLNFTQAWLVFIKRGLRIFGAGLIVTMFSLVFVPTAPIVFGVLHFIGLAVILAYPWLLSRRNWWPLIVLIVVIGIWFRYITVNSYDWLVLGLIPKSFSSLDFFPLFPWIGLVLAGIELGKVWYRNGQRQFSLVSAPTSHFSKFLIWTGQHALLIYLVHQPVIWLALWIAKLW